MAVYVTAPLCGEAQRELARHGGEAGDLRLRIVCLPPAERSGRIDLATVGANARRATQDSSAIAYIGEPTRVASRFSEPILETANVPQIAHSPGAPAMKKLLDVVEAIPSSGSLRQSINAELE